MESRRESVFFRVGRWFRPWFDEFVGIFHMEKSEDQAITLGRLFGVIGLHWRLLVIGGALGLFFASIYVIVAKPLYVATAIITTTHASSDDTGKMSSAYSKVLRFSGASPGQDPDMLKFLLLLKSQTVAERVDKKIHLLHTMFPQRWDEKTKTWVKPSGWAFEVKNRIKAFLKLPAYSEPGPIDITSYLNRNLRQEELEVPNTYKLSVFYRDKETAKAILVGLIDATNHVMLEFDKDDAENSEGYLLNKLQSSDVTLAEQRMALTSILVTQEQKLLLLHMNKYYVAKPIDYVTVSNSPVWPDTRLIFVIGLIIGTSLAVGLITIKCIS